jgi:hypothetical protein
MNPYAPAAMAPTPHRAARTLVIQSYRTHDVPAWLERCMGTVRDWADQSGYEYEFVDDRLFDVVPAWYRERCGRHRLPLTDLARLLLLREALRARDYDFAIWLDADILVFDPAALRMEDVASYALAREVWMARNAAGALVKVLGVNNSVVAMRRGNPALDFLIHACEAVVARHTERTLEHNSVGPQLLSALARAMPLPVVSGAGLSSPALSMELAGTQTAIDTEMLRVFARDSVEPLAALNLCGSLVDVPVHGLRLSERDLLVAMDRLLQTRGAVINRYRTA